MPHNTPARPALPSAGQRRRGGGRRHAARRRAPSFASGRGEGGELSTTRRACGAMVLEYPLPPSKGTAVLAKCNICVGNTRSPCVRCAPFCHRGERRPGWGLLVLSLVSEPQESKLPSALAPRVTWSSALRSRSWQAAASRSTCTCAGSPQQAASSARRWAVSEPGHGDRCAP